MSTVLSVYAVDYSLGGYLNGADVTSYNSSWKLTQSGSTYTITTSFSSSDNYIQIFSSDSKKYGASSYSTDQSVKLVLNGSEKVGIVGVSSQVTITFDPSTLTLTWSTSGSSDPTGNLKEPYVISVYIQDQWDEQYTFTKVPGSTNYEYEVSFEIPNYNPDADYKFWVGSENRWSDTYSENKRLKDYVSDCSTGSFSAKIYALGENGQPHGSTYKNFGIHDFKCTESSAKLTLSSNVREFDKADPPTNITLTAQADELTEGKYIWYKSDDEGATYAKLGETTSASYQLNYTPLNTRNYFKVERKKVDSNDMVSAITVIYTVQSCGEDTKGSKIFHEDFGELTALRGAGSRSSFPGVVSGYTYQEAPKKINDSFYAVVADPYYCGCGEGSDMNESVTDECLGRNAWFRQLRDHTLMNTGNTGPYGGMLLLNFKEKGIAYQRELTDAEKHDITKNSILKFSAYFASAAKKDPSFIGINMQLIIQFKKTNTTTWVNASDPIESRVNFDDGWQRAEVEWKVEDADGDFRVVIINNTDSGSGNDLLVDDISLDLCTPAFTLYFKDENGNQTEDKVATNVSETSNIQVKKINFGSLGDDPCIQLYQVIKQGNNTSYKYISDFSLNGEYYQTSIEGTDVFKTIPEEVELVAIASIKENRTCNDAIKEKIENGEYTPGAQTNAIFSGNYLTYSIACGTSKLENNESVTKVCQTAGLAKAKMPVLKLSSKNSSNIVYFDVYHNNEILFDDVVYRESQTGYMLLDLDAMYEDATGESYNWPAGNNTFKVQVKEQYIDDNTLCTRWAEGEVSINVVARPVISENLNGVEVCEGESKELKVTASPVTKYQWQEYKVGDDDWVNVGENSSTFNTPTTMGNETQYRVILYNDNDLMCETTSQEAVMTVVKCDDMNLTQSVNNSSVCKDEQVIYTIKLKNNAQGGATNVAVGVEWDPTLLAFKSTEGAFDEETSTWTVGEMDSKDEISIDLVFDVLVALDGQISIKSFISSLNEGTYGEYDRQPTTTMKGESLITSKPIADTPSKKRPNEIYSYNDCKKETPNTKVSYDFLIEGTGTGSSLNLVWMDEEKNVIAPEDAYFYADVPGEGLLYVYNAPEGYCDSEVIEVRYRVKDNTSNPEVENYEDCAIEGAELVLLKELVKNQEDYRYLKFFDQDKNEVRTFDPSTPSENVYRVVAFKDEIETCPSDTIDINVLVKDYAIDSNIDLSNQEICPKSNITLTPTAQFTEEQTNKVYRWYSDSNLDESSLLHTGESYTLSNVTEEKTLYVTIETSKYCENEPGFAKEVSITLKSASPELSITPKDQLITIGGEPSFTVTPQNVGQASEYKVLVNGTQIDALSTYKPYVDSEYTIVFEGECGVTSDTANVAVQWPTVFTPHVKDGRNDTFVTDMNPNFKTKIFNRFGGKVAEGDNGWDGTIKNGDKAVPGVYYYVVELPDGNVKKGTIEVFKY